MGRRDEGESAFEVDGKEWRLRFDMNAMADFAEATGREAMPLPDLIEYIASGVLPPGELRTLVWAMLREHHPDVTARQAGRMVTEALNSMQSAIGSALPQADGQAADEAGAEDLEKTKAATSRAA